VPAVYNSRLLKLKSGSVVFFRFIFIAESVHGQSSTDIISMVESCELTFSNFFFSPFCHFRLELQPNGLFFHFLFEAWQETTVRKKFLAGAALPL
jgi:hypothetical protein